MHVVAEELGIEDLQSMEDTLVDQDNSFDMTDDLECVPVTVSLGSPALGVSSVDSPTLSAITVCSPALGAVTVGSPALGAVTVDSSTMGVSVASPSLDLDAHMLEETLATHNNGPMQISQEATGLANRQECSGCQKKITERFLLKALDQYWHEDCLKCSCCDCRLGEVGSTLFTKANLLLCRRDYLRLFGTTGYCSACSKIIPAFEMVMRAKNNVYHLECFACQQCNHRFCVGDRFFLCDNKILCEYDYEERMVFANMSNLSYGYNALTQMKRQTQSLSDDVSSGYGSPSPSSL
ncbi:protein apterous-like [Gigantopelta aegis]|uniref:protein apterous-like n=1 Tax=Gigantopelta aegis TaxID=1735272 RepID=UPI001B88907D|nr:protein apterous-like [Gigantopelta aegis]